MAGPDENTKTGDNRGMTREPGTATPRPMGAPADANRGEFRAVDGVGMGRLEGLDFGEALVALRNDQRVSREGWNGRNQFLQLQRPDESSRMTVPYIYITTVQGNRVPWLASQTDLLARDWLLVTEVHLLRFGYDVVESGNLRRPGAYGISQDLRRRGDTGAARTTERL